MPWELRYLLGVDTTSLVLHKLAGAAHHRDSSRTSAQDADRRLRVLPFCPWCTSRLVTDVSSYRVACMGVKRAPDTR